MVSLYPPETPLSIYEQHEWWSDQWDPIAFGVDFDFSKTFFEQFCLLQKQVPRINIFNKNCENSEYTNHSKNLKNCYLCCGTFYSEDDLYTTWNLESKNCLDCYWCFSCELCYECSDCKHCYACRFMMNCQNCSDSGYCYDCIGCDNCILCSNLRNKKYFILNKEYSKDKFEQLKKGLYEKAQSELLSLFQDLRLKNIHRNVFQENCERCTGDYLVNCKGTQFAYNGSELENCKHCIDGERAKNCYDQLSFGHYSEFNYENHAEASCYQIFACNCCYNCKELMYSDLCHDSTHCFGCISLKRKQYCILNKQYTKEGYERLVPKIIEHLKKTGEWGEFFPVSISPFAYNETVAQDFYPLLKEEAIQNGFNWSDYEAQTPDVKKVIPASKIPNKIDKIPDEILDWAIVCEITNKPFKIVKPELEFYRKFSLPIPKRHPDQRHRDRIQRRNPRKLWNRKCMKCGKKIKTSYAPERPEIVYCEECYLKAIYSETNTSEKRAVFT